MAEPYKGERVPCEVRTGHTQYTHYLLEHLKMTGPRIRRLFAGLSSRRLGFDPVSVCVELGSGQNGQASGFPVSIFRPVLHTRLLLKKEFL
jgi:hypothetical protein